MSYIVPGNRPKGCSNCVFRHLVWYKPFWSSDQEHRNKHAIKCSLVPSCPELIFDNDETETVSDLCPLRDVPDELE